MKYNPGHSENVPKHLLGEIWLPENALEGRDTTPHNGTWATEMKTTTKKNSYQIKIDFLIPQEKEDGSGFDDFTEVTQQACVRP